MPPKHKRVLNLLTDRAVAGLVLCLVACCDIVAAPFIANQNQYLAHVLSNPGMNTVGDWFRNTVDPYPVFSVVAKLTYELAGIGGFRIAAFSGTLVAVMSVFLLARILAKRINSPNAALLGTVAVGLTLLPHTPHAFEGIAGQYIISTPAYLQPSMFGCFLFLAIVCFFEVAAKEKAPRKMLLGASFALAALSCALHPTYIVGATILLVAASATNFWQGEKPQIFVFASAGIALIALTVLANPALLSMAFSSDNYDAAVRRFTFERIPHHTRLLDWNPIDLIRISIAVISVHVAARKLNHPWIAHFIAASLIVGAATTLIVLLSGNAKLALLFPWRVSVFIMPVSFTVIAVWIASEIERMAPRWRWSRLAVISSAVAALYGCVATMQAKSPAQTDERTALVRAIHPIGTGLVPLDSANVRMNAPANIYVDWESPPYASNDLVEWWWRVDQVRQFEGNVDRFCSIKWHTPIRWMLLPEKEESPACIAHWKVAGHTRNWRVVEKVQAGHGW